MQIVCTTTIAAARVMFILGDAHLQAGQEFHVDGSDLPIHFNVHVKLHAPIMHQLQAIPDIRIETEESA